MHCIYNSCEKARDIGVVCCSHFLWIFRQLQTFWDDLLAHPLTLSRRTAYIYIYIYIRYALGPLNSRTATKVVGGDLIPAKKFSSGT